MSAQAAPEPPSTEPPHESSTLTLDDDDIDRIADALVAAVLREAGMAP
jgi:hypothetical protein